ncbi:hypothetical protein BH10BAC5_BH10BAC5_10530 [soil metagenome]
MKSKLFLVFSLTIIFVTISKIDLQAQYLFQDAFSPNVFNYPVECVPSPDNTNRMFVVQQRGLIYTVNTANPSSPKKLFLDISDRVSSSGSELGCLGIAFHPSYTTNRYFFVFYTTTTGTTYNEIVARYQVSPTNPDSALKSTEVIFITQPDPYSNHNGGKVTFGPDGYLYFGIGDGGSGGDPLGNGQSRTTLLAKISRIDVNTASGGNQYSIPPTNPYYNNTSGYRQEIWCYGVRNPWKFSFDAGNGDMWIGDVGQDLYEEIDRGYIGSNYGWKKMEGFHCYSPSTGCDTTGLTLPVFEYSHSVGNSITGGYVYRGSYAPELVGKYLYADYGSGKIWALTGSAPYTNTLIGTLSGPCSSFAQDNQKNIYAVSYSSSSGKIYKISDSRVGNGNLGSATPANFELLQNYPNPFNPSTKITFALPVNTIVTLKIYDVTGKVVAELLNSETMSAGVYTREFDGSKLGSGVFYYKMEAGNFTETRRMVMVK